ncbi:MAG: 3',5'-cyclic-nucleotide phosphodiesterase [Syntrophorhabdaceae bacterium]|nr:3',5'-cyclic-nucleotide phosphodiesterase [Syntrophorhabdaceae bacterium]
MEIEILGCYGNISGEYRATSFLINDTILLDAGTVTEVLDDRRIKQIKDTVITHTHIDHIKGLFPLADELVMMGERGIKLFGVERVIEIITKNLFNNLIWPDFTVIPSKTEAMINLESIELEKEFGIKGVTLRPILMTHTVYTTGFVVKEGGRGFMFTADTGPTKRFWEVVKEEKGIEFIIADVSFPNRMEHLARISGHMTLSILMEHIEKYGLKGIKIYLTHIKPFFLKEILADLEGLDYREIELLRQGSKLII